MSSSAGKRRKSSLFSQVIGKQAACSKVFFLLEKWERERANEVDWRQPFCMQRKVSLLYSLRHRYTIHARRFNHIDWMAIYACSHFGFGETAISAQHANKLCSSWFFPLDPQPTQFMAKLMLKCFLARRREWAHFVLQAPHWMAFIFFNWNPIYPFFAQFIEHGLKFRFPPQLIGHKLGTFLHVLR